MSGPQDLADGQVTVDLMLGGKFELVQPARGHHRAGLDAVLLASAIPASASGSVADLGAGAGAAGLCIAARCPGTHVVLAEREPDLIRCQQATLARPANRAISRRAVSVEVDLSLGERAREAAGLQPRSADIVVMNPPFLIPGRVRRSPSAARAAAHVAGEDGLDLWFRVATSVLKPGGELVVVFRADGLAELLAACGRRIGGLKLLPIHPRAGHAASRVLLSGRKGSRAPLKVLGGFVLHGARGNRYLPAAEAILRDGADLATAHPPWADGASDGVGHSEAAK